MRFIYSASANETLVATPTTPDEFVFASFAAGAHTIAGFNATQDMIELPGAQFTSFAAVQAATTATAGGAVIHLGASTSLLLAGVDATTLHASNFALA
jgi:Ca2+-binding RTX toxin-like protein